MNRSLGAFAGGLLIISGVPQAASLTPAITERLATLHQQTNIPLATLKDAVTQAHYDPSIIDAINRPYEAKPWYKYRPLFVTESRIEQGIKFWKAHAKTLARAEKKYGVPAQIIVAIIGVETRYGAYKGNNSVLDSLYTLGFHYPRRSKFFSREFASFIKLSQQQGWNIQSTKGSYAGAMGYGQFIPSSYLHYAVDFNGDGHRDLIDDPIDAIGSVANYFHQHHWQMGQPVAYPLKQVPASLTKLANKKRQTPYNWSQLKTQGVQLQQTITDKTPLNVLNLKATADSDKYWVTFKNFYVITRYNTSPLYAMAVYQLSQQLKHAYKP